MAEATGFIWNLFQQTTEVDRKSVSTVSLFIDDLGPGSIAFTSGNVIHFSDDYIERIDRDIKNDFNGVLYYEMTHVWLKANYAPVNWAAPGDGDRWDQGYLYTARFLDYCNDLKDGFVVELNKKLRDGYSDEFFCSVARKDG
ncbi:Basic secretory protein [Parasponia andersonii]|uniref:Basic secretory protein n=1 Tax=Parasponia andersonii TaxID=3476 RepID=A0A2P5DN77_PARAD|nr:Basic secretory protein [Parasponia andersonii]